MKATIYALTDYEDKVFYIGCTTQSLLLRLSGHISEARKNWPYTNQLKNEKIRALDYRIRIKELETVAVSGRNSACAQRSAAPIEHDWIKKFSKEGVELCNR